MEKKVNSSDILKDVLPSREEDLFDSLRGYCRLRIQVDPDEAYKLIAIPTVKAVIILDPFDAIVLYSSDSPLKNA